MVNRTFPMAYGTATPSTGCLKTSALAGHSDRTPADGSAGLAHGGSCHAHTVNSCPSSAAGGSDLRDDAVRLRNRRGRHSLRRCCNRYGEARNSNQPDQHSAPPFPITPTSHSSDLSQQGDGPAVSWPRFGTKRSRRMFLFIHPGFAVQPFAALACMGRSNAAAV